MVFKLVGENSRAGLARSVLLIVPPSKDGGLGWSPSIRFNLAGGGGDTPLGGAFSPPFSVFSGVKVDVLCLFLVFVPDQPSSTNFWSSSMVVLVLVVVDKDGLRR